MPYSKVPIPFDGFSDSLPFRTSVPNLTKECLNLFPFDSFDNRKRLGTRPPFRLIGDAGAASGIQGAISVESIVGKGSTAARKRRLIYVANGKVFATDLSGQPKQLKLVAQATYNGTVDIGGNILANGSGAGVVYDQSGALSNFGGSAVTAELLPDGVFDFGTGGSFDNKAAIFPSTRRVEMAHFRHVGPKDFENEKTSSTPPDVVNDFVYMTDGQRYVKVDMSLDDGTGVISAWIGASRTVFDTTLNNSSSEGNKAQLITQFGTRIALARVGSQLNNWFISKINNPFDWTPNAGTASEAQAGSTAVKFGQVGDNIVALSPIGTSGLLYACESSLVVLTNDPVFDDATLRRVSKEVGCLGPRATTNLGELGVLVASRQGVFGINPNDFNIDRGTRTTSGKLDALFATTDFEDAEIIMGFDEGRSMALVCITRSDDPTASRIFALSTDNGSWWPWQIGTSGLRAVNMIVPFRPVSGTRQVPYFFTDNGKIMVIPEEVAGGTDGKILTSTSFTDPGETPGDRVDHRATEDLQQFKSSLIIGPINSDPSRRVLLREIRFILGERNEILNNQILTPNITNGPYFTLVTGETAQRALGFEGNLSIQDVVNLLDGGNATELLNNGAGGPAAAVQFDGTTLDGGTLDGTYHTAGSGTKVFLFGGYATNPGSDSSWAITATDELINDSSWSGPSFWLLDRSSAGKWQITWTDANDEFVPNRVYYETENAVDGLPASIPLKDEFVGSGLADSIAVEGGQFLDRTESDKTVLERGRSNAKRVRIRASDIFINIEADGRSWALEDISVDVEDGGPFRSVD